MPEERLTVTLRYLATGTSFSAMHLEFSMGCSTIAKIVKETCQVLWEVLQPIEMPVPSVDDWLGVAAEFYNKTQFPNCVGAICGKHIKLEYPKYSRTCYSKHKQLFSLIIFGICDANYCFKIIDVGLFEKESDCNIFKKSAFGKTLYSNTVNFPSEIRLPGDIEGIPQPHVIVGDETFTLHKNLLRPFPGRILNDSRRKFNCRLSRARQTIEHTFSIFSNKWRVFHTAILASPDFAIVITKAACVLHNYVQRRDGCNTKDTFDYSMINVLGKRGVGNATTTAKAVREYFVKYFDDPENALS